MATVSTVKKMEFAVFIFLIITSTLVLTVGAVYLLFGTPLEATDVTVQNKGVYTEVKVNSMGDSEVITVLVNDVVVGEMYEDGDKIWIPHEDEDMVVAVRGGTVDAPSELHEFIIPGRKR